MQLWNSELSVLTSTCFTASAISASHTAPRLYNPTIPVRRRLLFTSKLFAAHIAPAAAGAEPGDAGDDAGWGVYGPEWRFYYDCMLAPVARQAAGMVHVIHEVQHAAHSLHQSAKPP